MASALQAKGIVTSKVYCLESTLASWKCTKRLVHKHKLSSHMEVLRKSVDELSTEDLHGGPLVAVLSEPYFYYAIEPWHKYGSLLANH